MLEKLKLEFFEELQTLHVNRVYRDLRFPKILLRDEVHSGPTIGPFFIACTIFFFFRRRVSSMVVFPLHSTFVECNFLIRSEVPVALFEYLLASLRSYSQIWQHLPNKATGGSIQLHSLVRKNVWLLHKKKTSLQNSEVKRHNEVK